MKTLEYSNLRWPLQFRDTDIRVLDSTIGGCTGPSILQPLFLAVPESKYEIECFYFYAKMETEVGRIKESIM